MNINGRSLFDEIISLDNLFLAWKEFKKGKSKKEDVQEFAKNFESHILSLHEELKNRNYKHSGYYSFCVKDPKLRHIHKACVRDRVLHHAVFRILYPIFDKLFIFDSYSCRLGKGTHRAVDRLEESARKVSKNNTKTCFILKCDIKKYFDSVGQDILFDLIKVKIQNEGAIWLIDEIIKSFLKGLPLGNITSQLFANVYLNELDRFIKHKLKIKYYIRYCDDFVILSTNELYLEDLIPRIEEFLKNNLKLYLHPRKITIIKYRQGIDFLGYVCFPYFRILRLKTEKRMIRNIKHKILDLKLAKISKQSFDQTIQSYLGVLKHCDSHNLKREIQCLIGEW